MNTYTATAHREGGWWTVEINDVGATQGRSVSEAQHMARALVVDLLEVPVEDVDVAIEFELPGEVRDEVDSAREASARAAAEQETAARRTRRAVRSLRRRGLSGNDVAHILGISPQRVSQLSRSKTNH